MAERDEAFAAAQAEQERLGNLLTPPECEISEEGVRKVVGYIQQRSIQARRFFADRSAEGLSPEDQAVLDNIRTTTLIASFVLSAILKPKDEERTWDAFFEMHERLDDWQRDEAIISDIAEEVGGDLLQSMVMTDTGSIPYRSPREKLEQEVPGIGDWVTYRLVEGALGTKAAEEFYAEIHPTQV